MSDIYAQPRQKHLNKKTTPQTLIIAILLALLSSPSLFIWDDEHYYIVKLSVLLMIVVTIVGLVISFIYRKTKTLDGFALAVASFSVFIYLALIILSFFIIEEEYSQWNIFAFPLVCIFAAFYYAGGILSAFLLGMHKRS